MMKTITLLLIGLTVPFFAPAQNKAANTFTLKINTKSLSAKLYLLYQHDGKKFIDSAIQNKGIYTFSGSVERPLNATLVADEQQLGLQGLTRNNNEGRPMDALKFYIYPGKIDLTVDNSIADARFSSPGINADNSRLQAMLKTIYTRQLAISNQLKSAQHVKSTNDTVGKNFTVTDRQIAYRLVQQLDSLNRAEMPVLKKFIDANPNSYISLVTLQDYSNRDPDMQEVAKIFNRLSPKVKNTLTGKEFNKFLTDRIDLTAGTPAPDFVQNDTAGKPVRLSSFKGKYLLLDFWASWCGPCRAENPEIVKIYNDFKLKNFTILGISLDEEDGRNNWLKAIKNDQLAWAQVSDLKHWDNHVVKLYSVRAIPQFFLIDPNGIIIARDLNPQELRKKLEEILSK